MIRMSNNMSCYSSNMINKMTLEMTGINPLSQTNPSKTPLPSSENNRKSL